MSAVNKGHLPKTLLENRYNSSEGFQDQNERETTQRTQNRSSFVSLVLSYLGEGPFQKTPM